jgi:thymidine kinase
MLTVFTGPMYAGKSSALISRAVAHAIAGQYVVAFKPDSDDRYDKINIVSHSNYSFPALPINKDFATLILRHVQEYEDTGNHVDVVCIDEAQFFDGVYEVVRELVYFKKKTVLVSGLAQDYKGDPFGDMPNILAIADDIVHLKSVCNKSNRVGVATRTFKKKHNGQQVEVGGKELYEARSFEHWLG